MIGAAATDITGHGSVNVGIGGTGRLGEQGCRSHDLARLAINLMLFLAFWFLLQFYSGTVSFGAQDSLSGGVAWWAHIGGFMSGIVLLFAFGVRRTARRAWLYR